jgi:DNA-binding response OmpR family regulator
MPMRATTRLLIVEDNAGDARLLQEMFCEPDSPAMEVRLVGTMRDAEALLAGGAVDVILLDLNLPDAQGLEAVQRTQTVARHVPLVVLTGLDDDAVAIQALQQGAQDYLVKNQIERRGLLRALRYAVERKAMEEALFAETERAQVTLTAIGDGVVCVDTAGQITFVNRFRRHHQSAGRRGAARGQLRAHGALQDQHSRRDLHIADVRQRWADRRRRGRHARRQRGAYIRAGNGALGAA